MFLIIFLLIFFPSFCNGEQIIRNNWSSEDGNILLYRLTDDTSLAELSLLSDDEDEIKPGVFILESECFQFGSFQPAGIWKFTVLSVPVDNRVLNEKDGLKPDRSKSSLQHPAAAFYTDSGGGGMFQYRDEFLQYSLWQTIFTESYFPLTIGLSHTHLETEPKREDDWYIEEDIPGHDFYCGVSDFRAEFPFSSFQIRSAASFSEYLPPGCSVMPVLTVFYKYHELTMRYWFNSDNWINRNLEKAEWEHYGDIILNLRLSRFYRTSSELSWGRNNTGMEEERELTAAIIREKGLNLEKLGYSLNESFEDNTREVIQEIDASARWRFGLWGLKSDGKIEYDPSGLAGWEVSGSVRRYHRLGITSTLDMTYKAEPGESEIKPVLEEAIKLKESWAIRMSAGYLFSMMTNRSTISEAPVFKIMIEWHHG